MTSDSTSAKRPRVVVTVGDLGGIGPEVVSKALADPLVRACAEWVVLGHAPGAFPHLPNIRAGDISFRAVEEAITLARKPVGDPARVLAIVTGPICKEAWALAGHGRYPGHTELLAERFGVDDAVMFFHAGAKVGDGSVGTHALNVALVTAHVPLARVPSVLTIGRVLAAIRRGAEACRGFGVPHPKIAICGVNPHAGENGVLGDEEARFIAPAIELAREEGLDVVGPVPGDTVFNGAVRGEVDLVVAMYHDQGLIPVKLLAWDRAVNCTLGLGVPRTSPDHGTAFDIAGRDTSNAGSMKVAMLLAASLASAAPHAH